MGKLERVWRGIVRKGFGPFLRDDVGPWIFSVGADAYIAFRTEIGNREPLPIPDRYTLVEISSGTDPEYPLERLVAFHARDELNAGRSQEAIRGDVVTDLGNGDSCWLLVDEPSREIAAWRWTGGRNTRYMRTIAKPVGLRDDEAITYRVYVDKAHRGMRLQNVLTDAILDRIRSRGVERVLNYTGIANVASLINGFRFADECMPLQRVRIRLLGRDHYVFPGFDPDGWTSCGQRRGASSAR